MASPQERLLADKSADQLYEQLWMGALRSGEDVNAPEVPVVVPGYEPATYDKKKGHAVAVEARQRLDAVHNHRMDMLKTLRGSKSHKELEPFERILIETQYWMGVEEWHSGASQSSSSAVAKKALSSLHRNAGRRATGAADDETSQSGAATDVSYHIPETPSYIRGKLRDYQIEGVNWILGLHNRCINGILADEMGLGKTFQTIATLATLKFTYGLPGPHLVVCPKSVVGNWYREVRQWCPSLSVFKFHAPSSIRPLMVKAHLHPTNNLKYDIIVTTFEMIISELSTFKKIPWQYLIVDEAHKLKNEESRAHSSLAMLKTNWRLIITGTPLQNNLRELWALLHFLSPELFTDGSSFEDWFDSSSGHEDTNAITRMHLILAPVMIRRLKADVNTGIPPKKEIYVSCSLSRRQREWYSTVVAKDAELLNKQSGGNLSRLNNIIMQLRKVVNHPYLMFGGEDGPPFKTDEGIIKHSGKMTVLDMLLRKLRQDKEGKHKVLIFSQFTSMLDVIEDYLSMMGYGYCRIDGSTTGLDREMQMAQFNAPNSEYFVFLLSTRAGGLGINLQAANHVVLYDSDWNPQMDLQAQDRAHRIGQKRSVRIYRFITDGTMEERIYKRALKKLYLDAMVVQQGRIQGGSNKRSNGTAEELLSMIRFGAEEIFKSRGKDVTEADIEQLLADGEAKQSALEGELKTSCQQSLASFKLGADEENLYEFEGITYNERDAAESKSLHIELPESIVGSVSQDELLDLCIPYGEISKCILHPNLKEAIVSFRSVLGAVDAKKALTKTKNWTIHFASRETATNLVSREMIDACFNTGAEKLGRGQRVREAVVFYSDEDVARLQQKREKAPPLKIPKPPHFPPWQLYNATRLIEIHNAEVAIMVRNWRMKHDRDDNASPRPGTSPTAANEDGTMPSAGDIEDLTLSNQEQEEKERLLSEGFPTWSNREFIRLRAAITTGKVGITDFRGISARVETKTEGEVRDYMQALLERGPRCIAKFDAIEASVKKAERKRKEEQDLLEATKWKVENVVGNAEENLKFPSSTARYDINIDRRMFLAAYDRGLDVVSTIGQEMRMSPDLRFDVYYQTRQDAFYSSRLLQLMTQVCREWKQPEESGMTLTDRTRRSKRTREGDVVESPEAPSVAEDEV